MPDPESRSLVLDVMYSRQSHPLHWLASSKFREVPHAPEGERLLSYSARRWEGQTDDSTVEISVSETISPDQVLTDDAIRARLDGMRASADAEFKRNHPEATVEHVKEDDLG